MAIDFGTAISRAWRYAINAKRISILSVFFIVVVLIVLFSLVSIFRTVIQGFSIANLLQAFVVGFAGIILSVLIILFPILMFTHNYANQKSLSKSANFAVSRYFRFLAANIVVAIISGVVSIIPLIGIILAIIVYLIFFFVQQEIGVSDSKFSKSLSDSYNVFKRNKLDTIITLILTMVFSIIIILIFAIPFFIVFFASIFSAASTGLSTMLANIPLFVITGIILIVGIAFATLFTNSIKTDVYMQIKRRKGKK